MTISYGRLARELGYGGQAPLPGQNVLSWLEDSEMRHLAEPNWYEFLQTYNLPETLQPGTMVDQQTEQAIRAAAELDPGVEPDYTEQDALDDLTAAAMTRMHEEVTLAFQAWLHSGLSLNMAELIDAMLGRCSPIVRDLARVAHDLAHTDTDS
jgi:hypothetical protein